LLAVGSLAGRPGAGQRPRPAAGAQRRPDVNEVADRLWYPIWDDPMPLDHSVRTLSQVGEAAESDLRVAQGLLDAGPSPGHGAGRQIGGSGKRLWEKRVGRGYPPSSTLGAGAPGSWRRCFSAGTRAPGGKGGLRDLQVLGYWRPLRPLWLRGGVRGATPASDMLHAVRIELQRENGRRSERLMLEDQDRVAVALGWTTARN